MSAQAESPPDSFGEPEGHVSRRTCKPNSVSPPKRDDGHSSRPRIAARLQRPTRKWWRFEQKRAKNFFSAPSLFGLAPCGVCPALAVTSQAVRSYRTFSPLPRQAGAVCFLWHFPSSRLQPGLPGVTWHIALRSSDFPRASFEKTLPATVRSSCYCRYYRGFSVE